MIANSFKRQPERIYRTLETLQEVHAHKLANPEFSSFEAQAPRPTHLGINRYARRQNERGRRVYSKVQLPKELENFLIVGSSRLISEFRTARKRREALRKATDVGRVVVTLNVSTAARNRHCIENLKEIERQRLLQRLGRAFLGRTLCPLVVGTLGLTERFIDSVADLKPFVHFLDLSFVSKLQLVLKVGKTIVDGRR